VRFTHSGWRLIDGHWVYLHADGAIGADGIVSGVEVKLHDSLEHFRLRLPKSRDELKQAIRKSLRLLDLGPERERITVPLLSAAYRAPLPKLTNFTVWLYGDTGNFKTAIAILAQQHFGTNFTEDNLPTWLSTASYSEVLAHAAAHMLWLVDDWVPSGTHADRERALRDAERLVRAVGNRSGRGRMRADGVTLRTPKPPRALPLSTGEDVLGLQSSRARMVIIAVNKGDIGKRILTQCQRAGRAGWYAMATAGYVRWLAPRHDALLKLIEKLVPELRNYLPAGRTSDNIAELAIGAAAFLSFAVDSKALTMKQADKLWDRMWAGFAESAQAQQKQQREAKPVVRFATLLNSAIGSGRAYIEPPDRSKAQPTFATETLHTGSECIGWSDRHGIYLDPDASLRAARAMANDLNTSVTMLAKQLHEQSMFVRTSLDNPKRPTYTVCKAIGGRVPDLWHVKLELLGVGEEGQQSSISVGAKVKAPAFANMHVQFVKCK
jgi:hypothetical protein